MEIILSHALDECLLRLSTQMSVDVNADTPLRLDPLSGSSGDREDLWRLNTEQEVFFLRVCLVSRPVL